MLLEPLQATSVGWMVWISGPSIGVELCGIALVLIALFGAVVMDLAQRLQLAGAE
jgi:hypothetical protein